MIYFDNAATTGKKPVSVIKEVQKSLLYNNANPGRSGHILSQKTAEQIYNVRENVADFFGCSGGENVVFTMNCTHAINIVIKGVLNKGDHIIISSLEHNSVLRPIVKSQVDYDIVPITTSDENLIEKEFEKYIKHNTKMIFCTGASNVTGQILPLRSLGKLCKKYNLLFGVDAAQLAGIKDINMKLFNIDFLCIAPHKGLYAPTGIGILLKEKHIENTLIEGGTGGNSMEYFQPVQSPERYESGTVNIPGILGVGAGLDFVKGIGIKKIFNKEHNLISSIYNGLKQNREIEIYNEINPNTAPVLCFNFKGVHSEQTAKLLSDCGIAVRGGFHCSPLAHKGLNTVSQGAVRVSVSYFNTIQETEYFKRVINGKNFRKKLKKCVE